MRLTRALVAVVLTAWAVACGSFDEAQEGAPSAPDASTPDATLDGSAPPAPDGAADAGVDAPTCEADTSSDPANCGACGHACGGGACTAGRCQPLEWYKAAAPPIALALTATRVVWAETNAVRSCQKSGCGSAPTDISTTGTVSALANDGNLVAWTRSDNTVNSALHDGTGSESVGGASTPRGLIVSTDGSTRTILFADLGATQISRTVGGASPTALYANSGAVNLVAPLGAARFAFTTVEGGSHRLYLADRDGGQKVPSLNSAVALHAIATRGNSTVAVATPSGLILRTNGGAAALTALGNDVVRVALDGPTMGEGVYVTTGAGEVRACRLTGCAAAVTVASGFLGPEAIVVDPEFVYFVDKPTSRILRVRKPVGF